MNLKFLILITITLGGCSNLQEFNLTESLPKIDFKKVLPEVNFNQLFNYQKPASNENPELTLEPFLTSSSSSISFAKGNFIAIADAALSSPEVLGARQTVLNSEISKSFINTQFNPNLNAIITPGISNINPLQVGALAALNFTKILFDGGKLTNQVSSAELALTAAQLKYLESVNQQLLKNSLAIINVSRFKAINYAANLRIERLDVLSDQLKTMENVGAIDATTMVQANRTIYGLYTQKAELEESFQQSEVSFAKLFGSTPNKGLKPLKITDFSDALTSQGIQLEKIPAINNEFILLKKSHKDLAVVKAQKSHSVSLSGEIDSTFAATKKTITPAVGLSISKNLFDGGRLDKQIESAETQIKIQEYKLSSVIKETKLQLAQLKSQIGNYKNLKSLNDKNIYYAEKEIDLLKSQVQIGRATISDIISAEARLFEFQLKSINLDTDFLISQISIAALIGTLSREFNIP
ncbi:MAG: TolC family protein [Rhodobacteraceae bacterium]|nr:TolC family protein [Paracoccaceae bacterium]